MTLGVEGLAGDDGDDGRRLPLSLGEFDERVLHQASRDLLRREGFRQRKRDTSGEERTARGSRYPSPGHEVPDWQFTPCECWTSRHGRTIMRGGGLRLEIVLEISTWYDSILKLSLFNGSGYL